MNTTNSNKVDPNFIKVKSKRKYTEEDVRRIVQSSLNNILFMYLNAETQRQRLLNENTANSKQLENMINDKITKTLYHVMFLRKKIRCY